MEEDCESLRVFFTFRKFNMATDAQSRDCISMPLVYTSWQYAYSLPVI